MTDSATQEVPDWKKNWTPDPDAPKAGNPNWKPGCKSPNPNGRPRKLQDKRTRVTEKLLNEAQKVLDVVIEKAKEGDMQAAALILGRTTPTLKSSSEKVSFDFDPKAPIVTQVESVLLSISQSELSPDDGRKIIEAIASLAGIKQIEELEQRLAALEAN